MQAWPATTASPIGFRQPDRCLVPMRVHPGLEVVGGDGEIEGGGFRGSSVIEHAARRPLFGHQSITKFHRTRILEVISCVVESKNCHVVWA